jgi:hypothetical protein
MRVAIDEDMRVALNRCRWCGVELQGGFRFCPNCGRPIDSPHRASHPPDPMGVVDASRLRWLPFLFAAGAIFWLVELAQFAAVAIAPAGRDQLTLTLTQAGFGGDLSTLLIADIAIVLFIEISAAVLHATAYFGLRGRRPWGWIAAVVVSAGWSLVLLGIPILVLLLRRTTRHAYGIG